MLPYDIADTSIAYINMLIHMQPIWFIAVRERLLEFYSATCYGIGGVTYLDGEGTIINLGEINRIACSVFPAPCLYMVCI